MTGIFRSGNLKMGTKGGPMKTYGEDGHVKPRREDSDV